MTDVLPPTTTTPAPQTTTPAPQRLEGEQLEEAIIKQIDYYFSRQNLANDAYLVSQMDSEMWVPVSIIAGFKKVHILTHDAEFILRVMSKSPNVVVDTQRQAIKPSWKLQRNTIILRECPSDATEEEIRQLFGGKFPITAVHSDVEATWFVTIDSEDNALDALMHLKNVTIRGQIVKARMKAEHLLKSSSVAQAYTQPYVMDPAYYHAYAAQYAQRVPYQQQQQYWDGQQDQNKERRPYRGGGGGGARRGQGAHGAQSAAPVAGQAQAGQQTHGGRPRGNSHGQGQAPFKGDGAQSTGGKGRGRKSKKTTEVKPAVINGTHIAPSVIVPLLNQQHFPSLPSPSGRPNKASFKSGYTADFRRFTKDDILKIITSVQDVSSRPANVIVAEPGVVEAKPNPTLEISKVPTLPEPEEEQEEQPETAAVAAPGVAVREWPSQKSPPPPSPSITSTPAIAIPATTTTTAAAPSTQAPTPAASSTPISPPATKKEVPLRKSAEQGNNGDNKTADAKEAAAPNSPSINSSSDAIRKSTYADIALGVGRTNSPPIANAVKSPTLTATPSPSLNNAPPTSLEGKPQ